MDGLQLRDEATRDRIRLAEEFLDPGIRRQLILYNAELNHHRRSKSSKVLAVSLICMQDAYIAHSYRADIILMLNRGMRRLTV